MGASVSRCRLLRSDCNPEASFSSDGTGTSCGIIGKENASKSDSLLKNMWNRHFGRCLTAKRLRVSVVHDVNEMLRPIKEFLVLGIDGLLEVTEFTREELKTMYRGFKTECPNGLIDRGTFLCIHNLLFPDGDPTVYAERLFVSFDRSNRGKLTFEDFVLGLSLCLHGNCHDKLQWAFRLYDLDGSGEIRKDELLTVVSGLYGLQRFKDGDKVREFHDGVNEHVEQLFKLMDLNDDGVITEDEFIGTCLQNDTLMIALSDPFTTPSHQPLLVCQHSEDLDEYEERDEPNEEDVDALMMRLQVTGRKCSSDTTYTQQSCLTNL